LTLKAKSSAISMTDPCGAIVRQYTFGARRICV